MDAGEPNLTKFESWTALKHRLAELQAEFKTLSDQERVLRDELVGVLSGVKATLAAHMSRRELEVLGGIRRRLTNKELANELHISERTTKWHVGRILQRFGVQNRRDLEDLAFSDVDSIRGDAPKGA